MAVPTQSLTTKSDQPKGGHQQMQESISTSYEQLPLLLNANLMAQTLGVSISSAYEFMHKRASQRCGSAAALWYPKKSSASGWSSKSGG